MILVTYLVTDCHQTTFLSAIVDTYISNNISYLLKPSHHPPCTFQGKSNSMQDLPTHLDDKLHFLLEPDTPNQDENNTNQWLNFLARIIFVVSVITQYLKR